MPPGRPVLLDFYADWCVSCKEMERYTFSDPAVIAEMDRFVLLQADVTDNDAEDQALMQGRFNIPGPPAILIFDAAGTELRGFRVVGFKPAEEFAAHLQQGAAMNGIKVILVTVLAGGISVGAAIFGERWFGDAKLGRGGPARGERADSLPDFSPAGPFRAPDVQRESGRQGLGNQLLGLLVPALRKRDANPDPCPTGL